MKALLWMALALLGAVAGCRKEGASLPGSDLTPAQVEEAIKDPEVQLVDVRSQGEWDSGRIAGARFIPITEFKGRLAEMDRSKPVITYCAAGGRSLQAMEILKKEGYTKVAHLSDGIDGWREAGKAVVR